MSVRARFIPERSNPGENEWFFAYTIEIANESDQTVQLLSRHWIITDADGKVEEVRGPRRRRPAADPGPRPNVRVHLGLPLITSFGVMQGTYQMVTTGRRSLGHHDRPVLPPRTRTPSI